jgi:hypothetical protein
VYAARTQRPAPPRAGHATTMQGHRQAVEAAQVAIGCRAGPWTSRQQRQTHREALRHLAIKAVVRTGIPAGLTIR